VLYDAVAVLASEEGVKALLTNPAARDFAADAFAHLKFVAYTEAALPLFEKAGIGDDLDDGCFNLSEGAVAGFVTACRKLRFWEREKAITG